MPRDGSMAPRGVHQEARGKHLGASVDPPAATAAALKSAYKSCNAAGTGFQRGAFQIAFELPTINTIACSIRLADEIPILKRTRPQ
jgi:hypothetical protein